MDTGCRSIFVAITGRIWNRTIKRVDTRVAENKCVDTSDASHIHGIPSLPTMNYFTLCGLTCND
jgi:hypothetical protein